MNIRIAVLCTALALGLAALPACNARVPVTATLPAAKVDLFNQGVKRIAIGDIRFADRRQESTASEIGEELRAALVNLGRFEILERSAVDSLMQEHQLNASGLVNSDSAAQLGKFTGATALIVGQVTKYHAEQKLSSKVERTPEGPKTWYQRNGTASLAVSFKIVDVQAGKVIAITPYSDVLALQEPGRDLWSSEAPAEINMDGVLLNLRQNAVSTFVRSIAPYQITFDVELESDSDLPALEEGNKSARIGEWAEAEASYRKAVELMPLHAGAHYNLGVALRSQGKFDAALAELKLAFKNKDSTKYQKEIDMTKRMAAGSLQK